MHHHQFSGSLVHLFKFNSYLDHFKKKCHGYDSKQCDSKAPVMQVFWGMQSTSLLPLFVVKNPDIPDLRVTAFRTFQSLKRKTKSQNGDAQSLLNLLSLAQITGISCKWDHHHHHHHVLLVARISLTFSRHFSLSFIASGRSSGQHPVSSHSLNVCSC